LQRLSDALHRIARRALPSQQSIPVKWFKMIGICSSDLVQRYVPLFDLWIGMIEGV
jgi:hypothetical protein